MSTFLTFATAAEGGVALPMPPWGFGVLTLVVFLALLGLVWMFRHTAQTMIEGGHGPSHGDFSHGGHVDDAPRHGTSAHDGRRH